MGRLSLLLVGGVAVVAARLFVWPPVDPPGHADAMVVLAGGRGERLERALELMEQGVAPVLAVSHGRDWPRGRAVCEGEHPFEVICFRPHPDVTRGEARWVAEEAARRGWGRVVLVTSPYHVTRTRLLVRRCFSGEVAVVSAPTDLGPTGFAARAARDAAALAWALAFERGC